MIIKPIRIFLILCLLFLSYSYCIYFKPLSIKSTSNFNIHKASAGRLVWQKYNCQSCHQLYSLGGYLGPDLTNIISQPNKGEVFIKAMLVSGIKQMPSFHLSPNEMNLLLEFLKSVDASGSSDPRKWKVNTIGMIEKNEN